MSCVAFLFKARLHNWSIPLERRRERERNSLTSTGLVNLGTAHFRGSPTTTTYTCQFRGYQAGQVSGQLTAVAVECGTNRGREDA